MSKTNQIALLLNFFCIICMSTLGSLSVFAQKPDSSINSIGSKRINKTPQIKASVPTYRPKYGLGFIQYSDLISSTKTIPQNPVKPEKILTVLKVYPNPVEKIFNIELPVAYGGNISLQIADPVGKIYEINKFRLNSEGPRIFKVDISNMFLRSGIYFLRIHSGIRKTEVIKLIIK